MRFVPHLHWHVPAIICQTAQPPARRTEGLRDWLLHATIPVDGDPGARLPQQLMI